MAKQETPPAPAPHSIAHTEFASKDPAATRAFLEKVFGWRFNSVEMPNGPYHMYEAPGGARGGVRSLNGPEPPSVVNYVDVTDLEAARKKVEKAGGTVVLPRVDVPGMGAFFWFQVPGGPVLACWQAIPPRR